MFQSWTSCKHVRDVEESVLVLVLLVDAAHEGGGGWQDLVDEDEDGLLRRKLNALADHVDELSDSEVGGDQVLLLVDGRDVRLFADDLCYHGVSIVSGLAASGR